MGNPLSVIVIIGSLAVAGCQTEQGHRALVGGGIGALGGGAIGALSGGSPLTGALIGGAGGAAIGALTADDGRHRTHRY